MNELDRLARIDELEAQGYTRAHALSVVDPPIVRRAPSKPKRRHAGYHSPEGKAKMAAASKERNFSRWARVRALGLRNLSVLARYDRGELV
jgi:hypothetical protein